MKRLIAMLALGAVTTLLAAGCDKAKAPTVSAPSIGVSTAPVAPVADTPPDVPKGAEAPTPKPGQNNDHSSPEFKKGGKVEVNK